MAKYSAIGQPENNNNHGGLLSDINLHIRLLIRKKYKGKYKAYCECRYRPNIHSKGPDFFVTKRGTDETIFMVEITDSYFNEIEKAQSYRRDDHYKGELFVYDYGETKHGKKWYKADENGDLKEGSQSEEFGDLNEIEFDGD